jgi:hypothetical protein
MERMINLGRFEIDIQKSILYDIEIYNIDREIQKLGKGWRVPKYSEMKYIFSLYSKFGILNIIEIENLYKCGESNDLSCYTDGNKIYPLVIDEYTGENGILDYILIKDI